MWNRSGESYHQPTPREREEAAQLIVPARGSYEDPGGPVRGYWEALVGGLFACAFMAAMGIASLYAAAHGGHVSSDSAGGGAGPQPFLGPLIIGLVFVTVAVVAPIKLLPRYLRYPASRLTWDEQGLHVTKFYGGTLAFRWEEVLGIRERWGRSQAGTDYSIGLLVVVSGGRSFTIDCVDNTKLLTDSEVESGYHELAAALKFHVWGRGLARNPRPPAGRVPLSDAPALPVAAPPSAPAQTECLWCGATFPAGTAQCPQCGRSVVATPAGPARVDAVVVDRPRQVPLGRIAFPRAPAEIFRPGRLYVQWWLWVLVALAVPTATAFSYHYAAQPRTDHSLRYAVLAGCAAAGGVAQLAWWALGYLRSAVALTGGGMYYRGPMTRTQFISWEGLEKVAVLRCTGASVGVLTDRTCITYASGVTARGTRVTLRVATSHRWVPPALDPDVEAGAIATALIQRAGLVVGLKSPTECTWVRPEARTA
jgi:hypothetical protein